MELPLDIGISPIFNVVHLYSYTVVDEGETSKSVDRGTTKKSQWRKQMPVAKPLEAEKILNAKVAKKTRRKEYLKYLVKWKDHSVEDSTWMDVVALRKVGYSVEDLMSGSS